MKERGTVLVVDGGGRGTALVDKYAQSPHVDKIIAVPGNDLMQENTEKPVRIFPQLKTTSVPEILEICEKEGVGLVDVAQDNAVEAGLVDVLTKRGIPTIGPTRDAGEIEWNKAFAREFGKRHDIPQPFFKICSSVEEGVNFLKEQPDQEWFVKAAFLAEGKGALPAHSNQEAIEKISELRKRFPEASKVFLIEKWIKGDRGIAGEEVSVFAVCDGKNFEIVGTAQDYKRANDGDKGENTGSMGSNAPALIITPEFLLRIKKDIFEKALNGLREEGRPYKGVSYLGGMIVIEQGLLVPKVVEFNARWGDPEAQVIVPGLLIDLFELGRAISIGDISGINLKIDGKARVVVTIAAKGYPGDYSQIRGKEIFGLDETRKVAGITIYGAAIRKNGNRYYADGGRLFYVVGEGRTVPQAQQKAYEAEEIIMSSRNNRDILHARADIGWRDAQRLRK